MLQAGDAAPSDWAVLAAGTDGRDGPTDAAGGIFTSNHSFDLKAANSALKQHDSYHFLEAQNGLFKQGQPALTLLISS